MSIANEIRARLRACRPGQIGWVEFEEACVEALRYLFVPPLTKPLMHKRNDSGVERQDAIFPNRNHEGAGNWVQLYKELNARMIPFEFKNFDVTEISPEELNETRNRLTQPIGRLAILCTNREPEDHAHIMRNTIYSEEKKVILFITPSHLIEMIAIKERNEDPSDLILDLIELFYVQHK